LPVSSGIKGLNNAPPPPPNFLLGFEEKKRNGRRKKVENVTQGATGAKFKAKVSQGINSVADPDHFDTDPAPTV
jgi:hypothetical protein